MQKPTGAPTIGNEYTTFMQTLIISDPATEEQVATAPPPNTEQPAANNLTANNISDIDNPSIASQATPNNLKEKEGMTLEQFKQMSEQLGGVFKNAETPGIEQVEGGTEYGLRSDQAQDVYGTSNTTIIEDTGGEQEYGESPTDYEYDDDHLSQPIKL